MTPEPVPEVDLSDGEVLIWTGQPDPAVLFTRADVVLVPLSLVWAGGIWGGAALSLVGGTSVSLGSILGGTPFLLIAFYVAAGRFVLKRRTRQLTHYAVTDQRAVVTCGERMSEVELSAVSPTVRRRRDGRHVTVTFRLGSRFFTPGRNGRTGLDFLSSTWRQPFAFYDVADVSGLAAALRTASERSA